jgi:23S rRNA (guanosine2251-2'-O)-methyltransferase
VNSVVFGLHPVRALLRQHPGRVRQLWLQQGREDARVAELRQLAQENGLRVQTRPAAELDHLAAGGVHQGVVAEVTPGPVLGEDDLDDLLRAAASQALLLVLDGVQDPHNLGACLRTADAAGVTAVIAPRDRAAGLTPAARKVAAGAAE